MGKCCIVTVTPCVGAWIEIEILGYDLDGKESLPAWECGLKSGKKNHNVKFEYVTPCVGVWIEMICPARFQTLLRSLPAWECGLKFWRKHWLGRGVRSLPAWECGLKSCCVDLPITNKGGHSLRGSVDWNNIKTNWQRKVDSHSLRGSVDWNYVQVVAAPVEKRHSLRGSVDWNGENGVLNEVFNHHFQRGSANSNCIKISWCWNNLCHSQRGSMDWKLLSWRCRLSDFASLPARKCELKIHKIKVVRQECECLREVYFCKQITIRIKRDLEKTINLIHLAITW